MSQNIAEILAYATASAAFLATVVGTTAHDAASKSKCEAIVDMLGRCKVIALAAGTDIAVAVRSAEFRKEHADAILNLLTAKMAHAAHDGRRDNQRWQSCHNFGTRDLWTAMTEDTSAACELFMGHLAKLGLINPSEPTSAWISAIVAAVQNGVAGAETLAQDKLQAIYDSVKATAKRMYRSEPLVYVVELPITAAELLKVFPAVALQVFTKVLVELARPFARGSSLSISPSL